MRQKPPILTDSPARNGQRGASGLEFALMAPFFFGIFYAIVSYAFITLLSLGLTQAAAEGARAVIQLNPTSFTSATSFQTAATAVATQSATNALSWLPQTALNAMAKSGSVKANFSATPVSVATASGNVTILAQTITVTVTYPNYIDNAIIPVLNFPFIGYVPALADTKNPTGHLDLVGTSSLRVTPVALVP